MSATHKTVKGPNPSERGLVVMVGETSLATSGGVLPAEGTLYSDAAWKSFFGNDYHKEFSNFVYNGQGEDTKDGGTLLFSMNKTVRQAWTPFRTTTDFKDFYWDPILLALVFIKDPLPRSSSYVNQSGAGVATSDRYRVREVYIPGGKIGTTIITREYLSPIPLTPPSYETPVPRAVSYDVPGASGGFPSCIGPKIVIPTLATGVITSVAGDTSGIGGALTGQVFPETNVLDWETRVIDFEQKLVPGGYHAVEVTVVAPEQPEFSIQ